MVDFIGTRGGNMQYGHLGFRRGELVVPSRVRIARRLSVIAMVAMTD